MPFYLSSDRTVVNAVKHAQWSPNRDLIACLTQDCQLHAFREFPSFQRIWALSFQSEPTAICWQPDGVRLAVGHNDGTISIIDAENGDTVLQTQNQDQPIACLAWSSMRVRDKDSYKLVHDMRTRYTRVCPVQQQQADQGATRPANNDSKTPKLVDRDYEVLDVLCSADTSGMVCLSAFGHYPMLSFSLAKVLKTSVGDKVGPSPKSVAQQLSLCPSLSRLFITYGTSADTSRPGTLGMAVCSLYGVSSRLTELHRVLLIAAALRNLMHEGKAVMSRVFRSLNSARSSFVKLFSLFSDADTHGEPGKRWDALKEPLRHSLMAALVRGVISPTLAVFVSRKPGEHGLKQAARTIDASFNAAQTDVSISLLDGLQRVVFLLDELQGLLASEAAYGSLGVQAR